MLPKNIYFVKGPASYKYTAVLPNGKKVNFGDTNYQQYKDSVPKNLGGGLWSHKDHNDKERRKNYRKRHAALICKTGRPCYKIKYSPSWFSYNYLW